jgi:hypothetical protein
MGRVDFSGSFTQFGISPLHHDHFDFFTLHDYRHDLGWGDIEMGTDAECRVEDPEPFTEIINADE